MSEDKKHLGIYGKFSVARCDGRDMTGEKHEDCALFVLDLDHDPFARVAAAAYAEACRAAGYAALSKDLRGMLNLLHKRSSDDGS